MNKRTMKKGLAIVLALVMVFAMTVTAFADTGSNGITVTVEFIDENYTVYEVKTVTVPENFTRQYTIPSNPGTDVITSNTPTVMDATYMALQELGVDVTSTNDLITGWDTVDPKGGMYITKMLGLQTETAADTSPTVWRGYAWEYQIGYVDAELYATNVALTNGMTISWWYRYCEEPMN